MLKMTTLTRRERDVLTAILNGSTAAQQVAEVLTIQRRTAENHIYRIRRKTGVRKAGLPWWAKRNLESEYVVASET